MKRFNQFLATLLMLSLTTAARAYDVAPVSDPQALGFSSARLDRIAAWQQTQVDAGAFSGAVAAMARDGKVVYLRAVGFRDNAKTIPLQPDAIFWIASMTKPVTSVAAMMLVDEGKLDLAAPVYQYLPEFNDMTVAVETKDPGTGTSDLKREAPNRPMTVEDLLRHTAGLTYPGENTTVHQLYVSLYRDSGAWGRDKTLADFVAALAKLPLARQPGEVWEYSNATDVLGRVIEVASGQPFDQFLETRLFKPLGTVDTAFWMPPEKLSRLIDPPGGSRPAIYDVTKPATLFAGGFGLVSTAADYLRFCQMLLNGGDLDGVRILKAATVRRMTTNSLPPDIRFVGELSSYVGPRGGSTWGLGFAIRRDAAWSVVPGSVGSFTWGGIWGTYFWIDPAERLIAMQLIQVAPTAVGPFQRTFRDLTYGGLSVPDRGIPASAAAPVTIDAATLRTYGDTYAFSSISAHDKQERGPVGNLPREFGGLGIDLRMEDGGAKVVSTLPHMPAAKAGIMTNDIITHLDGEPLQDLTLVQTIEKMRGSVGATARLRIVRKGQDAATE